MQDWQGEKSRKAMAGVRPRIEFIDGLRGAAIILVILFHAYARWGGIMPYGSAYQHFPLFEYGWAGVNLFFMISGYVILMTLRKTACFSEFIVRRWRRLFPAMLVASLLICSTAGMFSERPAGISQWKQMLPGLLFLQPDLIKFLTGFCTGVMEGSFWSIYVEVHFYFVIGLLFFLLGERQGLGVFAIICMLPALALLAQHQPLLTFFTKMGVIHFPWFLLGTILYRYSGEPAKLTIGFLTVLIIIYQSPSSPGITDPLDSAKRALLAGLFSLPFLLPQLQNIFRTPLLNLMGFISYPLYLIHENMMVAMIIKLGRSEVSAPLILLPVMPIAVLVLVAYAIAKFVEPWMRGAIDDTLQRVRPAAA